MSCCIGSVVATAIIKLAVTLVHQIIIWGLILNVVLIISHGCTGIHKQASFWSRMWPIVHPWDDFQHLITQPNLICRLSSLTECAMHWPFFSAWHPIRKQGLHFWMVSEQDKSHFFADESIMYHVIIFVCSSHSLVPLPLSPHCE